MPKCVIKSCRNNTLTTKKKDGVTYHRFPLHEIRREKWRKIVARERTEDSFKPNESSVICSSHFFESDIYYTKKGYKRLKKTALPHVELIDDPEPVQLRKRGLAEAASFEQLKPSDVLDLTADVLKQQQSLIPQTVDLVDKSTLSLPSESSSVLNTEISYFKKELIKCRNVLALKDRQVRNLKKQNKRLRTKNVSLKEIIKDLKKKWILWKIRSNIIKDKLSTS